MCLCPCVTQIHTPQVNTRTLTGAAGNISSALGTSSTPSPLTVATTSCTCILSATVTVILGKGPPPWGTHSLGESWAEPSLNLHCSSLL